MPTKKATANGRRATAQAPLWERERGEVLAAAKAIHRDGLVVATSGNVSARVRDSQRRSLMAITASSTSYEGMALGDIVVVDMEGDPVLGDAIPSVESLVHAAVYAARADVNAIVHTHSVYASALAVAGIPIPPIIDEMVAHLGDSVQVAQYGFPGTEELGEHVVAALSERNAVLLKNHGALAVGGSVDEAVRACQLLERLAHIYVVARSMGRSRQLPADALSAQVGLFHMRQEARRTESDGTGLSS